MGAYDNGNGTPGEVWTFTCDAFGREVEVSQQAGAASRTTTTAYYAEGRITQVVSPEGTVNYQYDGVTGLRTRTFTCYRPNCERTFSRIVTVEISGSKTGFCRNVENSGEEGANGPDLIAVDISAGSDVAPIVSDFRRSVREVCDSNRNDRMGRLRV
jgi:YD repeat-containing protein